MSSYTFQRQGPSPDTQLPAQHVNGNGARAGSGYQNGGGGVEAGVPRNEVYSMQIKGPVNEERHGGWSSTGFHTVTSVVGAGVLGLPFSLSYLTWGGGAAVLLLAWLTSYYTLWQLAHMHEQQDLDHNWIRFSRYHELAQHAMRSWGQRAGLWLLIPLQLIVLVGTGIVYMVVAGTNMERVWDLYKPIDAAGESPSFGLSCWILVFFGVQLFLSQMPNLYALRYISFASAVMSFAYTTIAASTAIAHGRATDVSYNIVGQIGSGDRSVADAIFGAFNAVGTVAFAFGGHSLALEIQTSLPKAPTTKTYMRGVKAAYIVITWAYPTVAFAGYWAFGDAVASNIFASLGTPRSVVAVGSLMVTVHMLGSYQLYSMPVYDMVEVWLMRRQVGGFETRRVGFFTRVAYRSLYTCFTAAFAITLPFFPEIMGFIGAFAIIPSNFIIPSVFYLVLKPEARQFTKHWWASWSCIIYGSLTCTFGCVGALRNIIVRASAYTYFQ